MKHLLVVLLFCLSLWANPNFPEPRRLSLRHIERGGVGYNTGYTTLETFISGDPNLWAVTPFFDGRGHLLDDGTWAANGGIGLRSELAGRIYGAYAYYDYRGTKHCNYNQASIGFETLGTLLDARINGYLPFSKKISAPYDTQFGYFSGHYLRLSQKFEFAMKGIDAEVGFHVGNCDSWNFAANAGPYCFQGSKGPNAWGGKVRASFSYQDWVTLEVVESYDNVFHNNVQGQISFSVPLGSKQKEKRTEKLYCRKLQPVARNEIVVLNTQHKHPVAINPETGEPYYFVFVNNTSSSAGTFESPYPSLALAQSNSAANQIIYVFAGNGTTTNMDQGITLKASQKFWGSGMAHNLQTEQGLVTVPQMSRTAPQITNSTLLGAGATLSTNNEISGIAFTETSGNAITGTDPVTFSLSSCTFTACGQGDLGLYPIVLQASSPLIATLENNTFTDNTDAGCLVKLFDGVSSARISANNNQASDNEANSGTVGLFNIEAHGAIGTCQLVMSNNVLQNNACGFCDITDFDSPHEGSFNSFQGTFTGNTCTGSTQAAAIIFQTNATNCAMTIQNNNFSDNGYGSIFVKGGAAGTQAITNATIVIDSNQLNNGGSHGDAITISPAGSTIAITISDNTINNNLGTAFVSYFDSPGPSATLAITNNVMTDNQNMGSNASGGISFDQFDSVSATIEGNTLSNNAQGNSIGVNGGGSNPATSTVTFTDNQLTSGDTFRFDFYGNAPSTGCLIISGNTSTTDPAYTFSQSGTGDCFIVPCAYETENTGGFTLNNVVTPSPSCAGSPCP